jgi:Rhodopirellula transposase DDE domain
VVNFTASMTWQGLHPVVELVTCVYESGVTLSKAAMASIEAQIARLPGLDKWFVDITPTACRDG